MNFLLFLVFFISFSFSLPPQQQTESHSFIRRIRNHFHERRRAKIKRRIDNINNSLETSLVILLPQTRNEAQFPRELSPWFFEEYHFMLLSIYLKIDDLIHYLGSYYGNENQVDYVLTQLSNDGINEYHSLLIFGQQQLRFNDGGLLYAIQYSRGLVPNSQSPVPDTNSIYGKYNDLQIESALDKQLEEICQKEEDDETNEEKEDGDVCFTCLNADNIGHKLKCCGKLHHRKCLESWYRTLETSQALRCPHCQKKV